MRRLVAVVAVIVGCSSPPPIDTTPTNPSSDETTEVAAIDAAPVDDRCRDDAEPLATLFAINQPPGFELKLLASGFWRDRSDSGCLDESEVDRVRGLAAKITRFGSSRCAQAEGYGVIVKAGSVTWSTLPRCRQSIPDELADLAEALAAIPKTPLKIRLVRDSAMSACVRSHSPILIDYRSQPEPGQQGARRHATILESGVWDTERAFGCLAKADRDELARLARGLRPRVKSSDQSCPKPASARFTLTVSGKKGLSWDDGGCGTVLDPTVDALLAKVRDLTAATW